MKGGVEGGTGGQGAENRDNVRGGVGLETGAVQYNTRRAFLVVT